MPRKSPSLDDVDSAIDVWFEQRIRCGAIAHHTPAYNQAFDARADLKVRMGQLFGSEAEKPKPDLLAKDAQDASGVEANPSPPEIQPAADAAPEQE